MHRNGYIGDIYLYIYTEEVVVSTSGSVDVVVGLSRPEA